MVADNPETKIDLKTFHCATLNDHEGLKEEQQWYKPIPVVREINSSIIQKNYLQIKQEIDDIVDTEMENLKEDSLRGEILKKERL